MANDEGTQPVADDATPEPQEPTSQPEPQETETQEPSQDEQSTQEEASAEEAQPQDNNEGADAPEPEEEEEPASDPDFSQYSGYQPQYDLPQSEDGTIDPVAFAQQIQQQTLAQVRFEQREARDWSAIDKKYGEQLTPTRRQMILNTRIANAVEGKQADLKKVADQIMKEFGASKSEGRAEASVSRKVQKAASLETATANSGPERGTNLMDRIADGDKGAATALFDDWLTNGKI